MCLALRKHSIGEGLGKLLWGGFAEAKSGHCFVFLGKHSRRIYIKELH